MCDHGPYAVVYVYGLEGVKCVTSGGASLTEYGIPTIDEATCSTKECIARHALMTLVGAPAGEPVCWFGHHLDTAWLKVSVAGLTT